MNKGLQQENSNFIIQMENKLLKKFNPINKKNKK